MYKKLEKTPEEVYDDLVTQGAYEEAGLDKDEIEKILRQIIEDYNYGKELRKLKDQNWRVIFHINYDSIRELCDLLMRFEKQKTSNHQGVFAFIILNFKDLNLDWHFFEKIRNTRNKNKYSGTDITKEMWKEIEFQIDLYVSTLKKEVENRLKI
ncbi:hypothetical protein HY837_05400 [archaeon]|nr:hypothetical protein [archaeon]